uniref:Uncharacterized protein n=1 Tax=Arundo donax TaxID=35708 RepID=A0A0A9B3B0_ARUDO
MFIMCEHNTDWYFCTTYNGPAPSNKKHKKILVTPCFR